MHIVKDIWGLLPGCLKCLTRKVRLEVQIHCMKCVKMYIYFMYIGLRFLAVEPRENVTSWRPNQLHNADQIDKINILISFIYFIDVFVCLFTEDDPPIIWQMVPHRYQADLNDARLETEPGFANVVSSPHPTP